MAAKVRPALVVNAGYGEADRALLTMVPHTTALRGSQYEIVVNATFLKPGAFLVQGVTSVPRPFALHRLGVLRQQAFDQVSDGLLRWLGY